MDLSLDNKVVMIAGGSAGLGRAVAEAFAAENARLSLASRSVDKLREASEGISSRYSVDVLTTPTDVRNESEIEQWVQATLTRFGGVDILVTNAGGPPSSRFEDTSVDAWRDGIELNLMSTILTCKAVVPHMRKRGSGSIVAITSVSVKQPVDGLILSNTSRAGVLGLTKSMSNELAPEGIRVNMVCPGYTRTDRLVELAGSVSKKEGVAVEEVYRRWETAIPMNRLGEPEEFASVVVFLASERASYVTGTCVQVDGGLVRGS